jgi:hypothetical protein
MNLEDFPMDIQRCPLKFGSCKYLFRVGGLLINGEHAQTSKIDVGVYARDGVVAINAHTCHSRPLGPENFQLGRPHDFYGSL